MSPTMRLSEPLRKTIARVCRKGGDPLEDLMLSCLVRHNIAAEIAQTAYLRYHAVPDGDPREERFHAASLRAGQLSSALFGCFARAKEPYPNQDRACAEAREAIAHPDFSAVDMFFSQRRVP